MNERLKELFRQAHEQKPTITVNPETFEPEHKIGNGGKPLYMTVFSPEKFAELIVAECAEIAYKTSWDDLVHGYGQAVIPLHLHNTIKQHFGVEE